mmetsp:Transcript_12871/g.11403  ORF Transcript_12871/g.11403 Transcript_12871/m.11403 type:complete len:173 (+) Transcript_12871:618-1136(+)
MRNLTTLVTSMMDDSERFMIAYQKCNSISLYSDTSSSNSDENYDGVPKMFHKKTRKAKHIQKVNEFMEEYKKEIWTGKDFRLLNGVCKREKLTNKEMDNLRKENQRENNYNSDSEVECVGIGYQRKQTYTKEETKSNNDYYSFKTPKNMNIEGIGDTSTYRLNRETPNSYNS